MARPEKILNDVQLAEVETLASVLTAAQMADYFGIGRTTFFSIMTRNEEVAERYKRGKARAIGAIAQSLITKARAGDTASMIFYLKTQGGWRETMQVAPVDARPAEYLDLTALSDEALEALLAVVKRADAPLGALVDHQSDQDADVAGPEAPHRNGRDR